MQTEMNKLSDLIELGETSALYEATHTVPCVLKASPNGHGMDSGAELIIESLEYTRGLLVALTPLSSFFWFTSFHAQAPPAYKRMDCISRLGAFMH